MSKTFARSSLCALTMTIMTAHAAEPPTNLDKPEGATGYYRLAGIHRTRTN